MKTTSPFLLLKFKGIPLTITLLDSSFTREHPVK